jgi:hypothetical protein
MKIRLTTLGTVMLASALPLLGAVLVIVDHPRAVSASAKAPDLLQSRLHHDVRTLSGKISHQYGKFIFREEPLGVVYALDDQRAAKNFSGSTVLITGTLDARSNLVHVHKIESVNRGSLNSSVGR